MSFQINDKVMQLENRGPWYENVEYSAPCGTPQDGVVYVVRDIVQDPNGWGLCLVGLPCIRLACGRDTGFDVAEFRKLEEVRQENRLRAEQPEPALQG